MIDPTNPLSFLMLIPFALAICAAGRQLNKFICPALVHPAIAPMERSAFGLATGAIMASQGVLALGLMSQLSQIPILVWFAVMLMFGIAEILPQIRDIISSITGLFQAGWTRMIWILAFGTIAFAAFGGCLLPPISSEWDSLSYHLADPKLYVAAHKIYYIPWESHSNFAFNMEMLYCVGLIFGGMTMAKAFAFKIGCISAVGVYYLGRRIFGGKNSGMLAALIFSTMPLAFWESGTAYVDLAATSFAVMGLLALVLMVKSGERRFAWLAGVMMGGMLGIKATALVTLGLYAIGIIAHARLNSPGTRKAVISAAAMVGIALVVGCSWYVKSFVYTGDPVYPFASSIFGARNWDPNQSAAYAADQHIFGMGHQASDLLLAPWNLSMFLVPGHIVPDGFPKPFNDYQTVIASLSPLFLIVLIAGLISRVGPRRGIRLLSEYCAIALVIWFVMTQQVRYLLPVMPVLCVVAESILLSLYARSLSGKIAAVIALTSALGFNLFVCGILSFQHWTTAAQGPAAVEAYLNGGLPSYWACEYINAHTPPNYKVVTYGEPETLYLDRDHMWGEQGHSTVIPYANFSKPSDLRAWLLQHGFHTILINTREANVSSSQPGWPGLVAGLTVDSGQAPMATQGAISVYAL